RRSRLRRGPGALGRSRRLRRPSRRGTCRGGAASATRGGARRGRASGGSPRRAGSPLHGGGPLLSTRYAHYLLGFSPRTESGHVGLLHTHGLACARVPGGTGGAGTLLEHTEAGDVDLLALVDRTDDDVDEVVDCLRGDLLVAQALGERFNELGLVGHSVLQEELRVTRPHRPTCAHGITNTAQIPNGTRIFSLSCARLRIRKPV